MEKSYFKDIYNYLSSLYPNHKVYVISDHHFYHKNILHYTRNQFSDVQEMNEYIIQKHNEVVSPDDIVIFLGDFCFKNVDIGVLNKQLNGKKFLLLGNHDEERLYLKKYREFGFENVFMFPLKFNDYYLSHYPIIGEHPKSILSNILEKELKAAFNSNPNAYNMYGHEHVDWNNYPNSINVSLEAQNYCPIYIGNTGIKVIDKPLIINSPDFEKMLSFFESKNINSNLLITDLIYTLMLEEAKSNPKVFFSGSFTAHKKYNYQGTFSDLDGTMLFDDTISRRANSNNLADFVYRIFYLLNANEHLNLAFRERYCDMSIFECIYANGNSRINKTMLDMNMISGIYKPTDFINYNGISDIESICRKYAPKKIEDFHFPNYNVNFLRNEGDISNLILQYLYQKGYPEKKKAILCKLNNIARNISLDSIDKNTLEDILIRFLIRNILFFYTRSRYSEIDAIKETKPKLNSFEGIIPVRLIELLESIINNPNSEYFHYFEELKKVKNEEIRDVSKMLVKQRF